MTDRYTLVSADCHAGADLHTYRDYLASSYHDDFDAWAADFDNPWEDLTDESKIRNWDNDVRQRQLEADGQAAEIVFPNTIPPFFPSGALVASPPKTAEELDLRWAGLQAHNRWLVEWCQDYPGRRAGLAQIFPNDVEASVAEVHWAAEHGLKGVLFPAVPPDADVPKLWTDVYDPIYRACEETGLSVNQHGGGGIPDYSTAKIKNFLMIMEVPFFANRSLWHIILSGVFERFPGLQFVMTEQKTGWVPDTLKKMDGIWYAFRNGGVGELRMDGNTLERSPSSYFETNCTMGASFPSKDEAAAIKTLGVGNVMWGSDYPHREGTWPDSVASLRHVFHDWDPADLHELFGGTAAKLYGLDLEPLAALELGPTVDEVATPLTEIPDNPSMAFGRRF
ncbi:MAG: amidohydrolase family protein [Actinomycetota bacterium]